MTQLRQSRQRLEDLGIEVKVVTFDRKELARNYIESMKLPWPLLLDEDRQAYQAYGMLYGNWWDLYSPGKIVRYIWLILRGQMPGPPGADWQQLGGDVLIDPQGIVRMLHRSQNPHDRPSIDQIVQIVEKTVM